MKNYLWTYVLQLKELAFHLADKDKEESEVIIKYQYNNIIISR